MSDSESFGENPFRSLAAGKFPDKDKKRQPGNGFAQDRSRRISPVSYTHLDVYKRQSVCR